MAVLDIRTLTKHDINEIVFSDDRFGRCSATMLKKNNEAECGYHDGFSIEDGQHFVSLFTKIDTENLIEALQKAIELRWVK